ncbi:MAG: PorP/SprF family type IX secretion system membrane protein [Bacteroidales bacterium]
MKQFNFIFIIFLLLFLSSYTFSQDIQFSHLQSTKLYMNPSFAGKEGIPNAVMGHRNFSPSNFGDYISHHVSFQKKSKILHGGIGFQLINDRQADGAINQIYGSGMYSYHFDISNNMKIQAGLEAKLAYFSVQDKDFTFPDMFDRYNWRMKDEGEYSYENLNDISDTYWEFNTGALFTYEKFMLRRYREFNVGVSVHHLNKPNAFFSKGDEKIDRRYSLYFDIEMLLVDRKSRSLIPILKPTVLLQQQGNVTTFHYGAFVEVSDLQFGLFLKHDRVFQYYKSIIFLGLDISNMNVSYSYDANLGSKMKKNPISDAHEVTLSINFQYNRDK